MSLASASAARPAPPRRTPKGERTAERILDAAEALFAEHGYAGTTLRAVADRVGVRIPSLYNHFASKDALYAAVLERGLAPVIAVLSDTLEPEGLGSRDSGELVERVMAVLAERPELPRLVQHETLTGGQHLTPMLRSWVTPLFARAHDLAMATPATRRWGPEQIPLLVLAFYHVVVGFFTIAPLLHEWVGEDPRDEAVIERQTRFLRQLVETLLPDEPPADA
ncbi:MAG: helix-turn-helix domain containing protein [Proteobacteria bacterium]|nr:helix-turn-helix domain containing protein [Pseudomonadota bacterium]MCZ6783765.1 helix-turn-helix domain containing protein [Pseudomonadota bacterium]